MARTIRSSKKEVIFHFDNIEFETPNYFVGKYITDVKVAYLYAESILLCNRPFPHVSQYFLYKNNKYGELCIGYNITEFKDFVFNKNYDAAYGMLAYILPKINIYSILSDVIHYRGYRHLNNIQICKCCHICDRSVNIYCKQCLEFFKRLKVKNHKDVEKCKYCGQLKLKNKQCTFTRYCYE